MLILRDMAPLRLPTGATDLLWLIPSSAALAPRNMV